MPVLSTSTPNAILQRELRKRLDPGAGSTDHRLDLDELDRPTYSDAVAAIRRALETGPAVAVYLGGELLGVATPAALGEDGRTLAEPGAGDHATLPGRSGQYRWIAYECVSDQKCRAYRVFHDDREIPQCRQHPGPPMRLLPWT